MRMSRDNGKVLVAEPVTPAESLSIEAQMTVTGQALVKQAQDMKITNTSEYEAAGTALRNIKGQVKKVKDYWTGPKTKAKAAHQEIVEKEKAMLKYFADAETIIKKSMAAYLEAVERAKAEAEAEAKRRQQEEAMRFVDEAAKAEEAGDAQAAAINMAMAEMVSDMTAAQGIEAPKAQGVSARKTWKARVTDAQAVPAYFGGMEIRKVDMAALNGIARMTKGTAQIPGVEFYEEATISARA